MKLLRANFEPATVTCESLFGLPKGNFLFGFVERNGHGLQFTSSQDWRLQGHARVPSSEGQEDARWRSL